MFETLFTYPAALRRHQEGPFAAEREAYVLDLADQAMARGTLLRRARYCLCIAFELQRWPRDRCFDEHEITEIAEQWAARRVASGQASSSRWPMEQFRFVATDFLRHLGRLHTAQAAAPGPYDSELSEFVAAQQEERWLSEATARSARWQIRKFLLYLEQRDIALSDVGPTEVDAFYEHMAQRWARRSIRTSAKMLRAWFRYCEARSWVQSGLADAILSPRIYRHEDLPLGPTWATVGRMLAETGGEDPASMRDHAIVLLLSVYALRSGEVRRLHLDDIDWQHDRIRFVRSKSKRQQVAPLEPRVGNALARYLRDGRPETGSRVVFLTLRAPHRPLSAGGLYHAVRRHFPMDDLPKKGRGPHGLRHACARHLANSNHTLKELGDHLGHRSPDATRVYAKVDLRSLRQVAFDGIGGLS